MTVHETPVAATVDWFTPPELFDKIGLRFDLDPAAPDELPSWIPADKHYSFAGQSRPWEGRVWLNPPYGASLPAFVERMCEHRHGIMLAPSRTETRWWQRAARSADAVCLLRDRIHFIRADGFQARSSHASTLFAWGQDCTLALQLADLGWVRDHPNLMDWLRFQPEPLPNDFTVTS